MTCNCFAYQHLLTLVVPAVCFHCGSGLMSYSRLSDLRTPRYCFPSYLPAFILPRRTLITAPCSSSSVSNTQLLKNLILPDVCSNLPVSCFLVAFTLSVVISSVFPLWNLSGYPGSFFLSSCYCFVGPPFRAVTGGSKHTQVCIDFITAAQNFPRLTRCCFSVVCVNIALQLEV